MTQRILIDKLEFYITNVCNLTCSGCNRYNNYKFAGWWSWKEAEPVLTQWAEKIDIQHPVILGGEPLLNPDIVQWINGIRRLWPHRSGVQVQSNGTRLDITPGLYEALDPTQGNWIGISLHSINHLEPLFTRIRNFLKHPIVETEDPSHPIGSRWQFTDVNAKHVHVWVNDNFVQSNIIERPDGTRTLYQSDPDVAHEICTFRQFKNYHMIQGEIYKCGPVALMAEFDDQYPLDISYEDRAIVHAPGRGLSIDEFDSRGAEFLANIDRVIPQCKFCPERYDYKPITFTDLKPNKI
jgi:sulfatase maturation enzyme AslB (radical SAM superfamily)